LLDRNLGNDRSRLNRDFLEITEVMVGDGSFRLEGLIPSLLNQAVPVRGNDLGNPLFEDLTAEAGRNQTPGRSRRQAIRQALIPRGTSIWCRICTRKRMLTKTMSDPPTLRRGIRAMGNHHDQGASDEWRQTGEPSQEEPNPKPDDRQAAGQPRGKTELGRELGPGDGDDPPPATGDEPSPR